MLRRDGSCLGLLARTTVTCCVKLLPYTRHNERLVLASHRINDQVRPLGEMMAADLDFNLFFSQKPLSIQTRTFFHYCASSSTRTPSPQQAAALENVLYH